MELRMSVGADGGRATRPGWRFVAATAGVLGAFAFPSAASDPAWRRAGEMDGIVVEQRVVEGSAHLEVRAAGRSRLPPGEVLETVWNHREYAEFVPYLKRLHILGEGPDWLLVYEQLALPIVTDRDYTIRLQRSTLPAARGFAVTFRSAPGEGPAEDASHVRVRAIEGSWALEPDGDGGTLAVYTVRSDPGGAIPAWLANRLQVQVTGRFVHAMLARAVARPR
jgi:hypothetical protein